MLIALPPEGWDQIRSALFELVPPERWNIALAYDSEGVTDATLYLEVRGENTSSATREAQRIYAAALKVAELPPTPPRLVGFTEPEAGPDQPSYLLLQARQLVEQGQWEWAVSAAQTAAELFARKALGVILKVKIRGRTKPRCRCSVASRSSSDEAGGF